MEGAELVELYLEDDADEDYSVTDVTWCISQKKVVDKCTNIVYNIFIRLREVFQIQSYTRKGARA